MLIKISIIIVNYNGLQFFKACLDSIKNQLSSIEHETIVVDNNSSDDSCNYLRVHFPEVILIESEENLGFGRANNLGVKNAKADTILLLNNDTIIQDQLDLAYNTLHSNREIGIVSINMLNSYNQYISAVGTFPTPFNMIKISLLNDRRDEFKTGQFHKDFYEVDWVCGAFMMLRKSDFELINGFDSDYFMYVEDVDLCKRLNNIGKKCIFIPNLSYVHFVGFNKSREFLLLKGYEIYTAKHFKGAGKIIAKIMISINRKVKALKAVFQ
jgi:GT2 family glycosyltransferase